MAITYDAGTNTITVVGGKWSGTVDAASTTTFIKDPALGGDVNGNPAVPGRQIYINSFTDKETWIRTILGGGWQGFSIAADNAFTTAPNSGTETYIVSYNFQDIYDTDVAGGWGVIQKLGDKQFTINANLVIGDGVTDTFLADIKASIEFADTQYSLKVLNKAIFMLGERYDGIPKSGCLLRHYSSGQNNAGAPTGGDWILYNTNLALAGEYKFDSSGTILARDVTFNGYKFNVNAALRLNTTGTFENCSFSHTLADTYRNFAQYIRANQNLDGVTLSNNVIWQLEFVFPDDLVVSGFKAGGGDKSFTAVRWGTGVDNSLILLSPEGTTLADWTLTNNDTASGTLYVKIAHLFNITISDSAGFLQNAVTYMADKNKTKVFEQLTDVNGTIPQQTVVTEQKDDTGTIVDYKPHILRIWKYGMRPISVTKTITTSTTDTFTMFPDSVITKTETDALAITGITITSGTFTDPTGNTYSYQVDCGGNTLNDVYHNFAARFGRIDATDTEINTAKTRTAEILQTSDGISFTGTQGYYFVNYSGKLTKTVADDGTVYIPPVTVDIKAPNLISGTRVQLYNVTKSVELDNTVVSGSTGYLFTTQLGASFNIEAGDEIRLRACWHSGTNAKLPIQSYGIVTTGGLTFTDKQVDDTKHNQLGYDGQLIDLDASPTTGEIKADYANIQIDVNDPDNLFDARKGIAWWRYITTTEQGIRTYDPTALEYNPDVYNIIVNGAIQIENIKTTPLKIINGVWKRADGGDIIASTSNTIWWIPNDRVYSIETGVSGLTAEESAKLLSLDTTNLDVPVSSRASQDSLDKHDKKQTTYKFM